MDKRVRKAEVHQNAEEELSLSRPMPDSSWKKNTRVSHVARMAKTVWILVAGTDQRIKVSYTLCKGWFWEFSANRNFSHLHEYSDPFEIYFLGWTSFAAVSGQGLTLSPSHPYAGKDGKVNRTIHCRCIFNAFASLCFRQWRHALQSRAAPSVPVPFRPSDLVQHCLTNLKQLYFNVLAHGRLVRNFRCQCNECQLGLEVVEVMTERYQLVPNWHSGFSATPRPDENGWLGGAIAHAKTKCHERIQ